MSEYKFKINGKDYNVCINSIEDGIAKVNVNGADYSVEIEGGSGAIASVDASASAGGAAALAGRATLGTVRGGTVSGANGGVERSETSAKAADSASAANAPAGANVVSPLPGVIIDVCVTQGEAVKKGQRIAVIEAMKMENDILAEKAGTVAELYVKKGDSVLEGADIASIA